MTTHTESDEHAPRDRKVIRILQQLFLLQLVWVASLAVLTFVLHIIWSTDWWYVRNETGQIVHGPIGPFSDDQIAVVAQVVPSTVIAIFVFAVGVAFVVAQVVPQARGTRAVEQLRDNLRLSLVISPAPPLVIGSAALVASGDSSELAGALLCLSVLYIIVALPILISILIDATDPAEFKSMLFKQGHRRTKSARSLINSFQGEPPIERPICPLKPEPPGFSLLRRWRRNRIQRCTDRTYDLVRTLRGWVRVSATTGDSRELFEALEGTLDLASNYSRYVMPVAHLSGSVPSIYWSHAHTTIERSPLFDAIMESFRSREPDKNAKRQPTDEFRKATKPWAPALMIRCPSGSSTHNNAGPDWTQLYGQLPATWFASEMGRTIVRAVEFGVEGNRLLDRDVARLLNTLQNAIVIFASDRATGNDSRSPAGYWSAGVGIHYLVEVGLGVKRCPTDQIEWFHDPFLRLVWLHKHFRRRARNPQPNPQTSEQLLALGAYAGALRVGEAIISAQPASHGSRADKVTNLREVIGTGLPDNPTLELWDDEVGSVIWLASEEAGPFASTDRREIRHCDPDVVEELLKALRRPFTKEMGSPTNSSNGSAGGPHAALQACFYSQPSVLLNIDGSR